MNRTRRGTALVAVSVIALVGAIAAPAFAASNRQIAKASTLKVSDLSETGWKAKPHTEDPPSKIPACAPTNKVEQAGKKYSAHSPDFENSATGAQITNTVYVFPSVAGQGLPCGVQAPDGPRVPPAVARPEARRFGRDRDGHCARCERRAPRHLRRRTRVSGDDHRGSG